MKAIVRCKAEGRFDGCCREDGHDGPHLWYAEVRADDGALWGGDGTSKRTALWLTEADDEKASAHLDFKAGPRLTDEELVAVGAWWDIIRSRAA